MIEVNHNPTWEQYAHAWWDLNSAIASYWPDAFLNQQYFCLWCEGAYAHGIHYAPALLQEERRTVALLSFNHYSVANQTIEVDYLAVQPKHPLQLVRAIEDCFVNTLSKPEINLLLGIFVDRPQVRRWAGHFGFQKFAQVGERIYTYRR